MDKLIGLLVVCLLIVGSIGLVCSYNDTGEVEDNMEEVYQGPVPQGYSEEHYRKTGETIKEVEN